MGSRLRRELREALPAGIKGLQRAVALEIADDARYDDDGRYDPEHGRCSRVRLADLVRWTGAKDELSVREMLRRMAVAGWEFRLPIGKGKDGRPLYAVPGQAMQFRVPDFEAPTTVGPCEREAPIVLAQGPTVVAEGPTTVGEGPTVVAEGPTTVGSPSQVLPPASHRDPTSSPAEPVETEPPVAAKVTDGGGGGSDLRSLAIHIADSLDYRGKPPTKKQRQTIIDRLVVWLEAGWTMDGLAIRLDTTGQAVRYAPGLYADRLDPAEMPDPEPMPAPSRTAAGVRGPLPTAAEIESATVESVFFGERPAAGPSVTWPAASQRAQALLAETRPGTDTTVRGWDDVKRQLAGHKPYSDDVWSAPAIAAEVAQVPWCGELECDPVSRTRDVDQPGGLKSSTYCPKCYPRRQWG